MMAAEVIAIAHNHMFRVKEKSILTSRAVFVNNLPMIGILNGNKDSTGCVRGGEGGPRHHSTFFLIY